MRKHRILCALVFVFAAAGVACLSILMGIVLPRQNVLAAQSTCIPVLRAAQVGGYVTLGRYEQNDNLSDGAEPIEWLVLERREGKLLLLSRHVLDYIPFNATDGLTVWDASTIRRWLDDTFYPAAFSAAERTTVLVSHVTPDRNTLFETDPGRATNSHVFLMGMAEVNTYFKTEADRMCLPTAYANAQGAIAVEGSGCMWWLRTPGYDCSATARVLEDGSVSFIGQPARRGLGVRPAVWVSCGEDMGA